VGLVRDRSAIDGRDGVSLSFSRCCLMHQRSSTLTTSPFK
jgi:hypothetical protein